LLGRSDECVLLPCLDMQPDISAVMNCCVVALIVFSSDMQAWMADSLYCIQQGRVQGEVGINLP